MEEYKIIIRNQLANARGIIIYSIIFGFIFYFTAIKGYGGGNPSEKFNLVILSGYLIQLIPQIALHLNYYFTNKKDVLLYDPDKREAIFIHDKKEVKFGLDTITSLILYKSFALHKKNAQFLAVDDYNHAIIILQSGTIIIVTSLMTGNEIKFPISEDKIQVKMNIYRWVKGSSLVLNIK